jgi:hypothetical protein
MLREAESSRPLGLPSGVTPAIKAAAYPVIMELERRGVTE